MDVRYGNPTQPTTPNGGDSYLLLRRPYGDPLYPDPNADRLLSDKYEKGQRRPALTLCYAVKRVSPLLRRFQRQQAHGRVERRRLAEQLGGSGSAFGR